MAVLSAAEILAASDLPTERVKVEEWGGEVIVRTLTGYERDKFEADSFAAKDSKVNLQNLRARLVALAVVDESGKRLFDDYSIQGLGRKSSKALDRVFEVAQRLSGIGQKDVEELEKNSESGQPAASVSA